jgi:N-acetylneuraminate 9-O-acetyltransferase
MPGAPRRSADAVTAACLQIDKLAVQMRWAVRSMILAAVAVALYIYANTIFLKPKLEYNALHPYTSWIPITLWIIVRNLTPTLRNYSLGLFGWLGCITLETYISQFHTWLHTGIPDGQPKQLLSLLGPECVPHTHTHTHTHTLLPRWHSRVFAT